MLHNYEIDNFGVIHQIEKQKFNYSDEYNNNYNKLGEIGVRMGHLRLGYVIGSIGKIPNSIMDIGVGNGDFIKTAKQIVSNCFINDIVKHDVEGTTWVDDITNQEVEVITMFDVLEHMEDMTIIKDFKCNYLVISLPNCELGTNDEWFSTWKHRKPDEHLHHFTRESLVKFIESNGYTLVNISNIEDTIRKSEHEFNNIITATFKK